MIKLWQLLIYGHIHEWRAIGKADLVGRGEVVGQVFYHECSICGKVKRQEK